MTAAMKGEAERSIRELSGPNHRTSKASVYKRPTGECSR